MASNSSNKEYIIEIIKAKRKFNSICLIFVRREPFSFDGGIEHCVRSEMDIAFKNNTDVLLITPINLPKNNIKQKVFEIELFLNEEKITSTLLDSLSIIISFLCPSAIIYHSLIDFEHNSLIRFLIYSRKITKNILWLHDLSYVCDSQILIRNNIFCSMQTVNSTYCFGCEFEPKRSELFKFYEYLIKSIDVLIFPSNVSKERFFNYFNLLSNDKINFKIYPHYHVTSKKIIKPRINFQESPICLAFFGHNVSHKGWYKFLDLVDVLESTRKFQFYHIGIAHHSDDRVKHIPFSELNHVDPVAELDLLCKSLNIHLAFFWSITLESFGMMLRQVLATQCAVLARGDDLALKEFIDDCDKIKFFNEFDDLISFVKNDAAVNDLLDKASQTVCSLQESEYSFSVLT